MPDQLSVTAMPVQTATATSPLMRPPAAMPAEARLPASVVAVEVASPVTVTTVTPRAFLRKIALCD